MVLKKGSPELFRVLSPMSSIRSVSIIMNCYNGSKYLVQAIESVISQTYQDWELIFWDNLSTDSSPDIVYSFSDERIKYFQSNSHTRLSEARNAAINVAQGEFIAFLDVDDWWEPSKLEKQLPLFQDVDVGLACSNFWILDERKASLKLAYSKSIPSGHQLANLLEQYTVALPTLMVRKSLLKRYEFAFDPDYHIIGDFDLVIRLSAHSKIARFDDSLATYRIHGANESLIRSEIQTAEIERWVAKNSHSELIGNNPKFEMVLSNLHFNLGISARRKGDIRAAISALNNIRNRNRKFKFLICFFIPLRILNRKFH